MRNLLIIAVMLVLLTAGCKSYQKITDTNIITTYPDGRVENKKEKVVETDKGFTIGSKGLGTYSIVRDVSFL